MFFLKNVEVTRCELMALRIMGEAYPLYVSRFLISCPAFRTY